MVIVAISNQNTTNLGPMVFMRNLYDGTLDHDTIGFQHDTRRFTGGLCPGAARQHHHWHRTQIT
jgi:hypothetical protein